MQLLQTNSLDFEILDADSLKNIIFVDASTYSTEPSTPLLVIVMPGSSRYLIAPIQAHKVNVIDSHNMGLSNALQSWTPVDLIDGVYCFTYKICPYDSQNVTKYYLRTTQIDRDLQRVYDKLQLVECAKDDILAIKKELIDIHIFLQSGKANATLGNIDKAGKDYAISRKKVSKLLTKICE